MHGIAGVERNRTIFSAVPSNMGIMKTALSALAWQAKGMEVLGASQLCTCLSAGRPHEMQGTCISKKLYRKIIHNRSLERKCYDHCKPQPLIR